MSSPRTPSRIVLDHYAAGQRGDLPGMIADLHPQVRWTEAAGFPCAGTHVGPDAVVRNVFAVIASDWSEFGFVLDEMLHMNDRVVALGWYRGLHRTSHARLDVRTAHVWQLAAGQVIAFEQFTDTALVAQAIRGDAP